MVEQSLHEGVPERHARVSTINGGSCSVDVQAASTAAAHPAASSLPATHPATTRCSPPAGPLQAERAQQAAAEAAEERAPLAVKGQAVGGLHFVQVVVGSVRAAQLACRPRGHPEALQALRRWRPRTWAA